MSALGALGALSRRGLAQVSSANPTLKGTAQSVIFINLNGAPSHLDTFDFKPGSWTPGDFNPQAGAGGIVLSQRLFPNLLRLSGNLVLLRSVQSHEAAHERGQFNLQTGHQSNPAFNAETPHIGAVVAHELSGGKLPPFLSLNGATSQGATFLGGTVEPVAAPSDPAGFNTLEHRFYGPDSQARFNQKYARLEAMDAANRTNPFDQAIADQTAYYQTAKGMMYDPAITSVFNMTPEERQRYGDTVFGRSCVVALHAVLAPSPARFVNVNHGGWDMHARMFDTGYLPNIYRLANELDRGVGALVDDLTRMGRLNDVLIVMMGEFGRTPGNLNGDMGRDHHKDAMTAVMIGGRTSGGRVIGATDKTGDQIINPGWSAGRPVEIEDITATIYSALGIDWTKTIAETPSKRAFAYVPNSFYHQPINEVFG